jgi:serine/threonine-protein kinase PpkA
VVIPAGSFLMGRPANEFEGAYFERPQHLVRLKSFAAAKFELTFDQWDACVNASGCTHRPSDQGWGRRNRPVINVHWDDAQQYVKWLSGKTGQPYRLLSEAEWEYAARAGTATSYPWGNKAGREYANYGKDECCGGVAQGADQWENTAPVGQFAANGFGLHDMHGNVSEWVMDVWHESYDGAPADGGPWLSGGYQTRRVLRGGAWQDTPRSLNSGSRSNSSQDYRSYNTGFRLARTL